MPVDFKDYYTVLGVARDADAEAIKKAFRKLARIYHPDIAKDKKNAEEKFKEINEAYEVLGDVEKRRKYDELGANWQAGERPPRPQSRNGYGGDGREGRDAQEFHFGGTGFSDFFEQFFGQSASGRPGFSFNEDDEGTRGPLRSASGPVPGHEIEGDILVTLDEVLKGSTRTISLQRVHQTTGEREDETFKVRIPPGAQEGRRIRVPGKGGPGYNGGPAGDLFLRVRLGAHPDFRFKESDLYYDLELAPWEAVLGATIMVPTLTGRVNVHIPAGANAGQQLRLRGQGLPNGAPNERGDLYVVVSVQIPQEITAEERELWDKLRLGSRFNPRAG